MTCIIGGVKNGVVYIGGDSAGVSGLKLRIRNDSKVFLKGEFAFGFTSSFRMGQIIRYDFDIPYHNPAKEDFDYLCTDFVNSLIAKFKEKGYATIKNGEVSGGVFLLGYRGGLYKIESDFQVGQVADNYDSCGCGESYALGALMAMEAEQITPEERIKRALHIAEYFSAGVSSPFKIINTGGA